RQRRERLLELRTSQRRTEAVVRAVAEGEVRRRRALARIERLGSRIRRLVMVGAPDREKDLLTGFEALAVDGDRLAHPAAHTGHRGAIPEHLLDQIRGREGARRDGFPEVRPPREDRDQPTELVLRRLVPREDEPR